MVVGANSDIGRAVVKRLLNRGDFVIALSRDTILLDKPEWNGAELKSLSFDFDAGHPVGSVFGDNLVGQDIHNLVYVAGHHKLQRLSRASDGDLERHLLLNVKGFIDFAKSFVSYRSSDEHGFRSIVGLASVAHRLGEAGLVSYSASKGAMVSAARSMAMEWAPKGVRVNTISPGWISGRRADSVANKIGSEGLARILSEYPLGFGMPDDVAAAACFLTDEASARWITGTDLVIDGGRSCR